MPIIRVPVTIDHGFPGGPAMNVWHVRTISNDDDGEGIGAALDNLYEFYNNVRGVLPSNTTIRMGEGMIRDPLGDPTYVDDDLRTIGPINSSPGTKSTLLAVVVSWRTTSASRSGRGRTFIGPLNNTANASDGTPTNTVVNTIRSEAAALVDRSQALNGYALGVLSVKQGIFRDFTGSSVRDRFAFLSSRRD